MAQQNQQRGIENVATSVVSRMVRLEGAALNNAMKRTCRDVKFVWMDPRMREHLHGIVGNRGAPKPPIGRGPKPHVVALELRG